VDKDSPEQIAQAVKEILDNPEAAQRVIGNAKRMVRERYDWDVVAKEMRERVFGRILN
jgi:glycosyltransferase involved in cell wall biosynthesis